MSGTYIVRALLADSPLLTATVPGIRIMAGDLPLGITRPAIGIRGIDDVPYQTISAAASRLITERVQVTVEADDYESMLAVYGLLPAAFPDTYGRVNGYNVVSIALDSGGPDIPDIDSSLYSKSRDVIVRWRTPTYLELIGGGALDLIGGDSIELIG